MNYFDELVLIERIKFWTNTVTLGLFRIFITLACVKYIFWN
jgi:hypothetical protein